ncbi:MAG: threonine--tRNA ligase [Elusimicrobia bacterium]|nr:threonine--tRNA ligase [Elusimicrobiota bacterium]
MPPSAAKKERSSEQERKERLSQLRHSCAHVMAQAVQELFPGTKIAIGPAIEDGFYYDFDSPHRFILEDLSRIEARMLEIAKGNHAFVGREVSADESRRYWEGRQERYKLEILKDLEGVITHYTHGAFTDLCRGGHLESTQDIRHLKLLSVAGAYWRGDEKNPMLQRIYGTAWFSREDLEAHLRRLEEAKKRDHRKLGAELDLFSVQELAGPGLIFWHPKGARVRLILEDWLKAEALRRGYQLVYSPHIAQVELWKTSGHADFYRDNMFKPIEVEKGHYQLKPMNCPFHILIYQSRLRSYRELPLRFAELGTVYRYERSGVLHGLLRVRGFTQDDAHIFCAPEVVEAEVEGCVDFALTVFKTFGFEKYAMEVSTWDPAKKGDYSGSAEDWERAQKALENVLERRAIPFRLIKGEAAFYGPKIDVKLIDAIGRSWQLSTVQFDFNLPQKFRLEYIAADGSRKTPVMVHRALYGSIERFFGILIEHYAGNFPLWLSPVQAKILTLTDAQAEPARALEARLAGAGFRTAVDLRPEKIGAKIRDAQLEKAPYMVVLGPKDVAAGTLSVRLRDGRQFNGVSEQELVRRLTQECAEKWISPRWETA